MKCLLGVACPVSRKWSINIVRFLFCVYILNGCVHGSFSMRAILFVLFVVVV